MLFKPDSTAVIGTKFIPEQSLKRVLLQAIKILCFFIKSETATETSKISFWTFNSYVKKYI